MNKNDLRYRKTEENLKQAFLSLMLQQDCRRITIRQLCQAAQCARNTFYQHYPDLEALKAHLIGAVLTAIADSFRAPKTDLAHIDTAQIRRYTQAIIASVSAQLTTLQALLAKDDGTFQKQLADVIYTQVMAGDRGLSKVADTAINRLNAAYLAAAVAGFIARWLTESAVSPAVAEQILFTIHQPTINTSSAYLATDPLK